MGFQPWPALSVGKTGSFDDVNGGTVGSRGTKLRSCYPKIASVARCNRTAFAIVAVPTVVEDRENVGIESGDWPVLPQRSDIMPQRIGVTSSHLVDPRVVSKPALNLALLFRGGTGTDACTKEDDQGEHY